MKVLTATQASRGFKDMLDAVEQDETFIIARAGRPIARVIPYQGRRLGALAAALGELERDPAWADQAAAARAWANAPDLENPWDPA